MAESGAVRSGGGRGDEGAAEALTGVAGETAVAFESGGDHRGLVRDAFGHQGSDHLEQPAVDRV